MKKKNIHLKQLMGCVNRENELLSRRDIERRIGDINEANPGYSRKQIIESQIAILEALIDDDTNIWRHISLGSSLLTMAVTILAGLFAINNGVDIINSVFLLYLIIIVGAVAILLLPFINESRRTNQVFLHRVLSYMLENEKNAEDAAPQNVTNKQILKGVDEIGD